MVSSLPLLSAVIRETLRTYNIVPRTNHMVVKDTQLDEYNIPAGTYILMNYAGISHDPKYFENPYEFNPDRWLKDNPNEFFEDQKTDVKLRNYDVTFSAGAHSCLGRNLGLLELRVLCAFIINHYSLSLPPNYTLEIDATSILKPKNDLLVHFTPRDLRR